MARIPKTKEELFTLTRSMMKFGVSSLFATGADFLCFTLVFTTFLPIFWAEIASAFVGMLINFYMQRRFVFDLKRNIHSAFILSIVLSFAFMFLGAFTLVELSQLSFFAEQLVLAKLLVMGLKFVLNYFTKRWVFEK